MKELQDIKPVIRFNKAKENEFYIYFITLPSDSFDISAVRDYGQMYIITGINTTNVKGQIIFHIIDWASTNQKRLSHVSYRAETLASSHADDRDYCIKQALKLFTKAENIHHVLNADSKELFNTITPLHDGKTYRLNQTVQRL